MAKKYKINMGNGETVDATLGPDIDLDEEEIYIGGKRFTEAEAEELAREMSRRHGAKGGRPRLSKGPTSVLNLRMPEVMKAELEEAAEHDGVKSSELARQAISEYLERRRAS